MIRKRNSILLCIALLMAMISGGTVSAKADVTGKDNDADTEINSAAEVGMTAADEIEETIFSKSDEDMFSDRDGKSVYSESESIHIQLNDTSAEASADSVIISGTTITITEAGTYIISGTLDDGMILVDADDTAKLQIVFDGVNIHSETTAALYVRSADKVFVTLADGTENILSGGGAFEPIDENNMDGTIYSRQDLTLNGSGTLTVISPAGHGIVCKDDLVFTGGTYMVTAASHGLDANDSIRIANAFIDIGAGKDGIHAENKDDASLGFVYIAGGTIDIEAEGDGISAGAYLQVQDGTINLLTGGGYENGTSQSSAFNGKFQGGDKSGHFFTKPDRNESSIEMPDSEKNANDIISSGDKSAGRNAFRESSGRKAAEESGSGMKTSEENGTGMTAAEEISTSMTAAEEISTSMKGLKAVSGILISNGVITIDSADDSIHSDASVIINGGTFEIASGDDGVHADETLTMNDSNMNISQSYEGLEAQKLYVNGGTIVLNSTDDGLNASGGTDSSGVAGGRDG